MLHLTKLGETSTVSNNYVDISRGTKRNASFKALRH